MADKDKDKSKIDLGLLEEDDEFEDFPCEGLLFELSTFFEFERISPIQIGFSRPKAMRTTT